MFCEDVAKLLKPLVFQFGSKEKYIVTPLEYLLNAEDFDEDYFGFCIFGISGSQSSWSVGKYLLGATFLRSYY